MLNCKAFWFPLINNVEVGAHYFAPSSAFSKGQFLPNETTIS